VTRCPEYDVKKGVRGKYAERVREGTNIVVLDPDVAAEFKGLSRSKQGAAPNPQSSSKAIETAPCLTSA